MKIVVIGGTGLIGTQLVEKLQSLGHETLAASPAKGINTITGVGLADALSGADAVIDVSNSPVYNESLAFFEQSGKNLVAAAKEAGIRHYVVLSIVGTPRLTESNYFRAKEIQESIVVQSGIPYTIVRATQFYEFMGPLADMYNQEGIVHITPAIVQPIASRDVAHKLAELVLASPFNRVINIAGPKRYSLPDIVGSYLSKIHDSRNVVADEKVGYDGVLVTDDRLSPESADWTSAQSFSEWFEEHFQKASQ
ncbi:SDR family oxidoreductase [Mucilaginibacter pallidiroseus]|uniref:SDR family oxidoreductase n=1 Tax=Mucilaginibacter pallidiroseus TaxID=2599295 RepID=A0A563TYE9_9SPHI|nr:SDR family oxidoreductase [Mucilaginibacter pallidiroseus]TWR24385.1 SDR family oxidoreductase [Mucilaginibacter pallidiroseus]